MEKISLLNKFEEHQIKNLKTITGGDHCRSYEVRFDDGSSFGQEFGDDGHLEGEWND